MITDHLILLIEETHLNVVQYYGKKPKKFVKQINDSSEDLVLSEPVDEKVMQVEIVVNDSKNKKRFTLGKLLLKLLVAIVIALLVIAVLIAIYAAITSKGAPAPLKAFEASLSKFYNKLFRRPDGYDFFTALRNLFTKLF